MKEGESLQESRKGAAVAIFLSKWVSQSLKEWKCINERIERIRLRIEDVWISVIQVYAPTEDSKNEVKDDFYEQLKVQ